MQLVIAEKPSVARDLARVLGVPARSGRGVTSFAGADVVITWCIGHLVELDEPAAYDSRWKAWRMSSLPMLPSEFRLRGARHALPQLRAISALLRDRRFAAVVNACDAGREGELIFRYVYQHAGSRLPVRRLWISSLTDDAIRRGFTALRSGREYEALADAARSRSEADWLVGMNATRALTVRGRDGGGDALYSIGRVQTPTLAILAAREREIAAFVPRAYWVVGAEVEAAGGARFAAQWRDGVVGRLASAALADALVARDRAVGAAIVEKVEQRVTREPPPQLFDLTSLQRTANRRFGFSAARTLELAQALYERHKLITYPRTDSRYLTRDVAAALAGPLGALAAVPAYQPFAAVLLAAPPRPGRRIVDDAKVRDHHAIIPTAATIALGRLDRDEARLFDLIARRFLAAFFPDAEIAITEAWLRVDAAAASAGSGSGSGSGSASGSGAPSGSGSGSGPGSGSGSGSASGSGPGARDREAILDVLPPPPDRYRARGRTRLVAGWQEVAGLGPEGARAPASEAGRGGGGDSDDDRDATATLPPLVEGQRLRARFAATERSTAPPPRYTEATLLGAMETAGKHIDDLALREAMKDAGLGTPATRAAIIETLLRRRYVARVRTHLVPTAMGLGLIEALPVPSLASPELTAAWEARLARIARGLDSRAAFMADIARYVVELVDAIRAAPPPASGLSSSVRPESVDRNTQRSVRPERSLERERGAESRGRAHFDQPAERGPAGPESKGAAIAFDGEAPPRRARSARAGAGRRTRTAAVTTRSRSSSRRPSPRRSSPPPDAPLRCPRCRQATLIRGSRGWGCSRWREGCGFVVWFETAGKKLTAAQLRDLVERGRTRPATFVGADGRELRGRLVLAADRPGGAVLEPAPR